ncbi:MAG: hypothetical protein AAGH67_03590 [Cyanobacteria bacterium P01_H01_bin.162]
MAAHIEWLQDRIAQLDKKIEHLSEQQSQWREDKALLTSVKGIGPAISTTLLAELPELGAQQQTNCRFSRLSAVQSR